MRKARLKCFCLIWIFAGLSSFGAMAQLSQPARYETTGKTSSNFSVLPLGKMGVALIHQKDKYEAGRNFWEITLLDTVLSETWVTEVELSNQQHLIGFEFRDKHVYFLFRMGTLDNGNLYLIQVNVSNHEMVNFDIEPKLDFKLSYFSVIGNSALFGGYISRQPAVYLFDMNTKLNKVIPGFFTKNTELLDLRSNQNNTFNALMIDRKNPEGKHLIFKTFDETGAMIIEDIIDIDQNKTLLSGITSTLMRDELLIAGTWGQANGKLALGLYTVKIDLADKQPILYYDFSQFDHFLDNNSPRKIARIKAKAEKKRKAGKLPSHSLYVNAARLTEGPEGFFLLSEVYSPMTSGGSNNWNYYNPGANPYGYGYYPYGFNSYGNRYSPYSYGNYPQRTDVSIRYSSVVLFDGQGKVSADTGQKVEDIKLPSLDQVTDFTIDPKKIVQLYKNENDLVFKATRRSDTSKVSESKIKVRLKSPDDKLRGEANDDSAVRHWFDNNLLVWGYESVREKTGNEHVFYVNKLRVD